ncbi:hypothetical protein [Peribacillus kribbensis]|uniref:hypothetical protein n=1 Tax=Peribacillus kribbensis TaxID=356658 RepID=UPI00040CC2B2|nr:hypothetical protein [Peribacillus kribbensis]
MNKILTKIGDHIVNFTCNSKHLYEYLSINFHSYETEEKAHLSIRVINGYGLSFQNYDVSITIDNNKIQYQRADYLIQVDPQYKNAVISVHDELALKHALTNLYSAFIVHHNWGLLIHSSCVIENKRAHIFSGHSGAGKSTAAKLSHPRELLSDEATIVKVSAEGITIFDSPFRSEIQNKNKQGGFPLGSIQLLRQSLDINRERMGRADAMLQLMDKVFFWPCEREETVKIIGLLKALVSQTPVYRLDFQKNNRFWELIS